MAWFDPPESGGFPVLKFSLYKDNNLYGEVDASKNLLQVTGLTLGAQYKFQVTATNEVGESLHSPSIRVTFANRPDPPASLTLSATSQPSITANWTATPDSKGDMPSGYRLYIDNGDGGVWRLVFDGSNDQPATLSFVIGSNIECGGIYNLNVTAVNVAGESDGTLQ